jgi:hypothetical protein
MDGDRAPTIPDDPVERELQALLAEEAASRRPDRIGARGNPAIEHADVERGREQLDRLLGW